MWYSASEEDVMVRRKPLRWVGWHGFDPFMAFITGLSLLSFLMMLPHFGIALLWPYVGLDPRGFLEELYPGENRL